MNADDRWRQRAAAAWDVLGEAVVCRLVGPKRVHEPRRWRVVFAWPLSQVLHAAVLLDAAGADTAGLDPAAVWASLRRYRRGGAFLDVPVVGKRYYDDNAWIGLACAQAALLPAGGSSSVEATTIPPPHPPIAAITTDSPLPQPPSEVEDPPGVPSLPAPPPPDRGDWVRRAERSMAFVAGGATADGGVRWVEGGANVHACSTGAAGALAAALQQTGTPAAESMAATVGSTRRFLVSRLRLPDGLVADHITPDGRRDDAVYSYNQGLLVQLHLALGDTDAAAALAQTALDRFAAERLYTHPACFNAIFLRSLLRLWATTGEQRWRDPVIQYLARCWDGGRDDRGLFTRVGRYDSGVVLDHAALVGLMAAATLDRDATLRLF